MSYAAKYGNYVIIHSDELSKHLNIYSTAWYVLDLSNKKIVGSYHTKDMAEICAKGLDKTDRKALDEEVEKILKEN